MIILIVGSWTACDLMRALARTERTEVIAIEERAPVLTPEQVMQSLSVKFSQAITLRDLKPYEVSPGQPLALPAPRPMSPPCSRLAEGGHRRKERDYG